MKTLLMIVGMLLAAAVGADAAIAQAPELCVRTAQQQGQFDLELRMPGKGANPRMTVEAGRWGTLEVALDAATQLKLRARVNAENQPVRVSCQVTVAVTGGFQQWIAEDEPWPTGEWKALRQEETAQPAAGEFGGIAEIRLSRGVPGSPTAEAVTIKEPATINELVATIKLEKKNPCACLHLESAVFVKDTGEIKVSLCDHCFDFDGKTHVMPAGFYALFQKALPQTVYLRSPITVESVFADGTIARVWPDKIELSVPEREVPEPLRPVINAKTVITVDGEPARPADLRVGMAAHVVFEEEKPSDGRIATDTAKEIKARSAPEVQERGLQLERDADHFVLELRYFGRQDKPYYNIRFGGSQAQMPEKGGFVLSAQLKDEQVRRLVAHLAVEGFLAAARDVRFKEMKQPAGPCYVMTARAKDVELWEELPWSMAMLRRFDALRTVLGADANAAKALDIFLGRMAGHRREWERNAVPPATVVLRVSRNEGSTTEQHVNGKLTAKGTWVRVLEVLKNKGPEKLAKDKQVEILWDPDAKGLPAGECTVHLEPYRGENWKEGLYSYRLVGADSANDAAAEPRIIAHLESKHRTSTYVAIWTLRQAKIEAPDIDFDRSHSEAEPKLQALVKSLRELSKDRLAKLDESLAYHWSIYSPIWAKEGEGWPGVRPAAKAEPKTVPSPIP